MNDIRVMQPFERMRDTIARTGHIRCPRIRVEVLDALEWANEAHARTQRDWPYYGLGRLIARLRSQARRELRRVRK